MTEQPRAVVDAVRRVMTLLVRGSYSELVRLSNGTRMTESEMREAIADYGRELVDPPDDLEPHLNVVPVRDADPPRWSVNVPVWTAEEGRSDLTLSVTVVEADRAPGYAVEIDDLHVL